MKSQDRPFVGKKPRYEPGEQLYIEGTDPRKPRLNSRRIARLRYTPGTTAVEIMGQAYREIMEYLDAGRVPPPMQHAIISMCEQELHDKLSSDRPTWCNPENN